MTKKRLIPCLKELRQVRAWSQDQLAEISGLSVRTIQRIENGGPASYETLKSLAAAFDIAMDELTERKPEENKSTRNETKASHFLVRIEEGSQLFNLLGNIHGYQFYNDEAKDRPDTELIARFIQDMKDWGECWDEVEPADRIVTAREYTDRIQELEEKGLWVFAARAKRKMQDHNGPFHFNILVVYILKSDNPEIIKSTPSKATVYANAT